MGGVIDGLWLSLLRVSSERDSEAHAAHPNPQDICEHAASVHLYLNTHRHPQQRGKLQTGFFRSHEGKLSTTSLRDVADWFSWKWATGQTVVIMSLQIHSSDTGTDLEGLGGNWSQLSHSYPDIVDVYDCSVFHRCLQAKKRP